MGYVSFLDDIFPMKTKVFSISIFVLPADVMLETEKLPRIGPVFEDWTLDVARENIIRLMGCIQFSRSVSFKGVGNGLGTTSKGVLGGSFRIYENSTTGW